MISEATASGSVTLGRFEVGAWSRVWFPRSRLFALCQI